MQAHQGHLIDHINLRVADLEASKRFYRAVLQALGRTFTTESSRHFSCDELWVDWADGPVSQVHFAFHAPSIEAVHAFHAAALAHGGQDNGQPGERPYRPGCYGAFALDPDGNNVEAVYHAQVDDPAMAAQKAEADLRG